MFAIDGGGNLLRLRARPANWERLALDGWQFLPENRPWDADERELAVKAIGLHDISPSAMEADDAWLKRCVEEYCNTGRITLTASA